MYKQRNSAKNINLVENAFEKRAYTLELRFRTKRARNNTPFKKYQVFDLKEFRNCVKNQDLSLWKFRKK